MSSSIRLLTEEQSAKIAEVSVDTIRKYRDCGLLDPIVKDNRTFFQELDIRTLFYAKFKERERVFEPPAEPVPIVEPAPEATPEPAPVLEAIHAEPVEEIPAIPAVEVVGQTNDLPAAGELVEINKSLRDQIQILREERDWLRERIEKLEARSEREQMLLLSESENVRKLINTTRKGFWQRALPWLGQ